MDAIDLWYEPEFIFDAPGVDSNPNATNYMTSARKIERYEAYNEFIYLSVRWAGIRHPVLALITEDRRIRIHPGQTRCRALRRLGVKTVPAVIADRYGIYAGTGERCGAKMAAAIQDILRSEVRLSDRKALSRREVQTT